MRSLCPLSAAWRTRHVEVSKSSGADDQVWTKLEEFDFRVAVPVSKYGATGRRAGPPGRRWDFSHTVSRLPDLAFPSDAEKRPLAAWALVEENFWRR
jgi:hypothetical protein